MSTEACCTEDGIRILLKLLEREGLLDGNLLPGSELGPPVVDECTHRIIRRVYGQIWDANGQNRVAGGSVPVVGILGRVTPGGAPVMLDMSIRYDEGDCGADLLNFPVKLVQISDLHDALKVQIRELLYFLLVAQCQVSHRCYEKRENVRQLWTQCCASCSATHSP